MKPSLHIAFILWGIINTVIAQVPCSGSWAVNNPDSENCISGQLVGALNPAIDPSGCPINPIYTSSQTNTYTFANPVAGFTIDFTRFNSSAGCARIEVKIDGVFYPLSFANITHFSHSTNIPCRSPAFNLTVTNDGYLTSSSSIGIGTEIKGGIIFSNLNATTVTISTNDASGTLFSDPYNCSSPVTLCSGSWARQYPITQQCFSGQYIGEPLSVNPVGCPTNPVYTPAQTNTFTFTNPVSNFSIDFQGFDASSQCARMRLDVNNVFFHLTPSNITPLPVGSECTGTSVMFATSDGYLTSNSNIGGGQGRITVSGINAASISVSTNDGAGIAVSNPFNCNSIIPLKLESFTGRSNNCKALLNWRTGIEQNVRDIEIQRSKDATVFSKIGNVLPKGSYNSYSFICDNNTTGYFRLKIIDFDGHYEFSNVLSVKSNCSNTLYKVLPNPASNSIEIVGLENNDNVFVLDISGRKALAFKSSPTNNKFEIQKLTPGMYILQVINNGIIKSNLKVIKN